MRYAQKFIFIHRIWIKTECAGTQLIMTCEKTFNHLSMKTVFTFLIFLLFAFNGAQAQFTKHIISLTDKNNNPFSIQQPEVFLSAKAIARRTRQHLSIDSSDLPVNPSYLDSLKSAGAVTVLNTSKWLNQVLIQTSDANALDKIRSFSFVKKVTQAAPVSVTGTMEDRINFAARSPPSVSRPK